MLLYYEELEANLQYCLISWSEYVSLKKAQNMTIRRKLDIQAFLG